MNFLDFIRYIFCHQNTHGLILSTTFRQSKLWFEKISDELSINNIEIKSKIQRADEQTLYFENGNSLRAIPYNNGSKTCGLRANFVLIPTKEEFDDNRLKNVLLPLLVVPFFLMRDKQYFSGFSHRPFIYYLEDEKFEEKLFNYNEKL